MMHSRIRDLPNNTMDCSDKDLLTTRHDGTHGKTPIVEAEVGVSALGAVLRANARLRAE